MKMRRQRFDIRWMHERLLDGLHGQQHLVVEIDDLNASQPLAQAA